MLPFIFAKVYILVRLYTFYCKFFYVLHCLHSLKSIIQFQTKLIFTFNICIFVRQIYKKIYQRFVKICVKLQTIAFTTILKWALWISGFYIKQKIFKSGSFLSYSDLEKVKKSRNSVKWKPCSKLSQLHFPPNKTLNAFWGGFETITIYNVSESSIFDIIKSFTYIKMFLKWNIEIK